MATLTLWRWPNFELTKWHTIARPNGQAMVSLLWVFWRNRTKDIERIISTLGRGKWLPMGVNDPDCLVVDCTPRRLVGVWWGAQAFLVDGVGGQVLVSSPQGACGVWHHHRGLVASSGQAYNKHKQGTIIYTAQWIKVMELQHKFVIYVLS